MGLKGRGGGVQREGGLNPLVKLQRPSLFAEDGARLPRKKDGTRSSEDHDLRRCSGRRAKGKETKMSNSEEVRAFQVVVGTEAILSGLRRFAVWSELLQRLVPRILLPKWRSKVHRSGPKHRIVLPPM